MSDLILDSRGLYFPPAIDNSMRKELVKCQKIASWKFEQGLNSEDLSEDLVAGGAFAKGIEEARRTYYLLKGNETQALEDGIAALYKQYGDFKCPPAKKYKTSKTADRMAGALAYYIGERPLNGAEFEPFMIDGRLSVEISFNHEIPIQHPYLDRWLTYCGRFDMLGKDANGDVWVVDEKTTGQMGDAWMNQWMLDSALTGYCWGARGMLLDAGMGDLNVVGAVINGVAIRALSNDQPYETMKVPVFREDWEIQRWYAQMFRDVSGWVDAFQKQNHNQVLDHACALYNAPCQFARLCKSRNPERLTGTYNVRFWNPLERDN